MTPFTMFTAWIIALFWADTSDIRSDMYYPYERYGHLLSRGIGNKVSLLIRQAPLVGMGRGTRKK